MSIGIHGYKYTIHLLFFVCTIGEFHVFDPPVPVSARLPTPSHGPLNDADSASRKFTLDFIGTPRISKRLGKKGAHKE